jgi:hypothetical protein
MRSDVVVFGSEDRETFCRSRASLYRLGLTVPNRRMRHKGIEQVLCGMSYVVDRAIESFFVCLRWSRESAKLSNELNSGRPNLVFGGRRRKIVKCFNISAHNKLL